MDRPHGSEQHRQRKTAVVAKLGAEDGTSCHQPPLLLFFFSTISPGLLNLGHVMAGKPIGDHVLKHQIYCSRRPGREIMIISSRYDDTLTAGGSTRIIFLLSFLSSRASHAFKPRLFGVWALCVATEVRRFSS